jgi:hypothetical protein
MHSSDQTATVLHTYAHKCIHKHRIRVPTVPLVREHILLASHQGGLLHMYTYVRGVQKANNSVQHVPDDWRSG